MPPKTKAPPQKKPTTSAKPARKAKAVLSEIEQLKRLFRALCAQIDGGHLVNAIKTCDKILRISPLDVDAAQTKLFLLLQTERYADALVLAGDQDKHAFERAYALYRLQREDEARPILDALKDSSGSQERGVQHLEAQMAYRQGQYDTALESYTQLLDTAEPNSEEHTDILTNLNATQSHVDFLASGYLTSVNALPSSLLSTLESAPPPSTAQPIASTSTTTAPAAPPAPIAPKAPRARRIPKGIIPGTSPAPDPERWIKKRERSTFVQRKRRGGGGAGGATQGVALEVMPGQLTAAPPAPSAIGKKKGKKK